MRKIFIVSSVLVLLFLQAQFARSQTTEFSYQGFLKNGAVAASGNYDFEFLLFDALSAGNQVGPIVALNNVPVTDGNFSVKLNFGNVFSGAGRYLELRVKPSGQPGLTILTPRQLFTSAPYSVKSLSSAAADNAAQLGGVAASQYVQTTDPRLSDARPPTPGSANYIQNGTAQQASTNFNISGSGTVGGTLTAGTVNAVISYNIAGNRVLDAAGANLYVGINAGPNSRGGLAARNSFFGYSAGNNNDAGNDNAFFGYNAGILNTSSFNSFFGSNAGDSNTTGTRNSFFGRFAGSANQSGSDNSFLGYQAGNLNTAGSSNTFIGYQAGNTNSGGNNNTAIGWGADVGSGSLSYATAIGAGAVVTSANTVTLGRAIGSDSVVIPGSLFVKRLDFGGGASLCASSPVGQLSYCASSLRYKTDVRSFSGGLNIVKRLRPIAFNWKDGGLHDVGFGAEDVEKIEPLLVIYNKDGRVEGVKYGQITTVLVNAVNEQQAQIEIQRTIVNDLKVNDALLRDEIARQNELIRRQQMRLQALWSLVCKSNSKAAICKEVKK